MENKTAEEVFEQYTLMHNLYGRGNKNDIIAAMHTYAQQQSIGFAEWLNNDDTKEMLLESPVLPSTSDLYQIYSQQKGK